MIEARTFPRAELTAETTRRIAVRRAHGQDERTARHLVACELLLEDGIDRLGPAATADHASGALDRLVDALAILLSVVPNAATVISERGYRVVKAGDGAARTTDRDERAYMAPGE